MTIDQFSKILYKELPSQNLAFIEGGVLVYPQMIGLSLPLTMNEDDLYLYLSLYSRVMNKLSLAKSESEGKALVETLAKELGVASDKFKKDNQYIYMTESVLAGKPLLTSFDSIQSLYRSQRDRSLSILEDLESSVKENTREVAKKVQEKIAEVLNNVKSKKVEPNVQPPTFTTAQLPLLPINEGTVRETTESGTVDPQKEESPTILGKTKTFLTKPPVLIAIVVLGGLALSNTLLGSNEGEEEEPRRLPNKKKKKSGYRR